MPILETLHVALQSITTHKLRSFFTLLGIIVSVTFLVAVVAIIQGMNAYVRENIAGAIVGRNAFQIRRIPISASLIDDEEWRELLTAEQYRILREHGTERAGTGALLKNHEDGEYPYAACKPPLYAADTKF